MSAGRRGLILSISFALLALGLCQTRARAQQPFGQPVRPGGFNDPGTGRHEIWQQQLTPDQLRQLFSEFGQGGDLDKEVENLFRNAVKKEKPNVTDEQLDAVFKLARENPELFNRLKDIAQKHKNNPNRPPGAEVRPQDVERDLARLREKFAREGKPDPFKVPKFDPEKLPKFDPNQFDPKNFDPEEFPHADPKNPPKIDPDSGLPLNPRTGQPFDPRTGRPLDPKTGEPPAPKVGPNQGNRLAPMTDPPENPPKADGPPKADPKPPEPEPKFDPERPQAPKDTPERLAKQKAYDTATALWEKNVGPIDETPAVKRAIYDLLSDREAMDALTDEKGRSLFDMFNDAGDGEGLKDLFGGLDGKWEWPKLDWKLDWGKNSNIEFPEARPRTRWPDTSGSRWPSGGNWGGWGSFNFGGVQVPWLLFVILLVIVAAAVVWWKWDAIASLRTGRGRVVADGLGPWPVDPHAINSREDVVLAFEYLSVLICGPGAKTWTHSTVAEELTVLARSQPDTALKLARLYELARYAPLDEPLTRAELLEARRLVCDLAGVD